MFQKSLGMGILFMTLVPSYAEDIKAKVATCSACHGHNGISPNSLWPNLAGQKKEYLIKQIQSFRDGTRKDPMMSPLAKNIAEADIEEIAHYFSNLKPN